MPPSERLTTHQLIVDCGTSQLRMVCISYFRFREAIDVVGIKKLSFFL